MAGLTQLQFVKLLGRTLQLSFADRRQTAVCEPRGLIVEIRETGVSLGRRRHSPQCRQRTAILLLQLWQGCVKISAQLLAQFNIHVEFTSRY